MKNRSNTSIVRGLSAIVVLLLSGTGYAATTWDLQANCVASDGLPSSTCTGTASNIKLQGYSTGTGTATVTNPTSGTTFAAANLYNYDPNGLGIVAVNEQSGPTGPHAMDNGFGTDAMLLDFSDAFSNGVNLTGLTIGWNATDTNATSRNCAIPSNIPSNQTTNTDTRCRSGDTALLYKDSDISVLAKTATGTLTLAGLGSGWQLIGNYGNVGSGSDFEAISTTVSSSYWLISAYSSTLFGNSTCTTANCNDSNVDAFKIVSIAGNITPPPPSNQTPEPGTLALVGVALFGFLAMRRRNERIV